MTKAPPTLSDGDGYEAMMGRWSRIAGRRFLEWLDPAPGLRWLDVGCGNGAFIETLFDAAQAAHVTGIDPSDGLLATARRRLEGRAAELVRGDAQALPFEHASFDAAVMALVINFVPDPPKAIAEMRRVVRPGGHLSAYIWDISNGGFTMEPIRVALDKRGVAAPVAGAEKSERAYMERVFRDAGLAQVETHSYEITLNYAGFDDFWAANTGIPNSVAGAVKTLDPEALDALKAELDETLVDPATGRIATTAKVNAVQGQCPA